MLPGPVELNSSFCFPTLSAISRNPNIYLNRCTGMKDLHRGGGGHGIYCVPQLRSLSSDVSASSATSLNSDCGESYSLASSFQNDSYPLLGQQILQHGRYASEDYSHVDSDLETEPSSNKKASNLDNIDDWKWKLNMLIQSKSEREIVSREKKDRRDFKQLSLLATKFGLHSRQYTRVVVFSKVPLPNYRPDLDDMRPLREVTMPTALQRRIEGLLQEYFSQKTIGKGSVLGPPPFRRSSSNGSSATDEVLFEQQEPFSFVNDASEKHVWRMNVQMRDQQLDWKESPEGKKMQEFRRSLPSYKERDILLKVISENQVVVISGETGCGKTTQVPHYILESEIEACRGTACSIICTQPRRISAMAVSERVSAERGEQLGESVGYKVRLEGCKGRDTRLLFCTTGILLRRLLIDRNLKGVTHVFVDEIHERGINEDFLLIVLKDLLPRRPELRLVLMSATLNSELFSLYFGGAPIVHIPGFTYPVQSYFLEDVLEITGYVLTPYNQVDDYGLEKMWKTQKQAVGKRKSQIASIVVGALEAADFEGYSSKTKESLSHWNPDSIGFNLIENILCYICKEEEDGAILVFMTGWDDINALKEQLQAHSFLGDPSNVLLLACHGSMASSEQKLVFDKPQNGVRKIILATNMAETSNTIDDVVFVVDCGKAKETSYDALSNTPCLLPSWVSKAAAKQRRGRAGRVQPGKCYHLYPRCVYDAFADFQLPEFLRTPLQSLCLQIKSLQLGSIPEFVSRAIQAPELLSVQNAVEYLKIVGALDESENLTVLGNYLSVLPVEPKLGKMLILGAILNCLDPIVTIVAGLSVRDLFLMPFDKKDLAESAKSKFSAGEYSDHLAIVRAYEGWKAADRGCSGYDYCWKNFLSLPTLKAIESLRNQFLSLLKDAGLVENSFWTSNVNIWSQDEYLIRAVICAGLYPGVSSVVNKEKSVALKTMEDGHVSLYSSSVNSREQRIPYPWLIFNEKIKVKSVFLRDSTAVSDSVLLLFGGKLCQGASGGHLKMFGRHLEFFMKAFLAETYSKLKKELDELIQIKLRDPKYDILANGKLLSAVRLLISADPCDGRFFFDCQRHLQLSRHSEPTPINKVSTMPKNANGAGCDNSKSQLQTLVTRAGYVPPTYKTTQLSNNQFQTMVEFNGMQFIGHPCQNKKLSEKDAAAEALRWLTGGTDPCHEGIDRMSLLLKQSKSKQHRKE